MAATRPRPFFALLLALLLVAAACTDSDRETTETGGGETAQDEGGETAASEFRFQPLEPGAVTVTALRQGDIDIALLFSTVGAIAANDWVVLEDDEGLQGSENIVPLVRSRAVDDNAAEVLDAVSAELTTEDVTELNRRVDDDKEDPADVARDFLEEKDLLEVDSPEGSGSLRIGTFNFTESQIMGHMYAEALEANGYAVSVEDSLGSREQVVYPAIVSGQLDIVPEYIQSLLVHLDPDAESVSPDEGVERIEDLLPEGLELLEPSEAQDQNALVVTAETAEKYDLGEVSDLRAVEESLTLGGPPECPERPLCIPGYEAVYGLRFAS